MRGPDLEAELDSALTRARANLAHAQAALDATHQQRSALEQRLSAALHAIAEARLSAAARSEALAALGEVDAQLATVSQRRAQRVSALRDELQNTTAACAAADAAQREAEAAAKAARDEAEGLRAIALEAFAATEPAVALRAAVTAADEAHDRAAGAEAEAELRLREYVQQVRHPVHTYLRGRGYGTPGYGAFGLVRLLDRLAAQASRYAEVYLREQLLVGACDSRAIETAQAEARLQAAEAAWSDAAEQAIAETPAGPADDIADAREIAFAQRRAEWAERSAEVEAVAASIAAIEAGRDEDARAAHAQVVTELVRLGAAARARAVADTRDSSDDQAHAEAIAVEAELLSVAADAQLRAAEAEAQSLAIGRMQQLRAEALRRGWTGQQSRFDGLDLPALVLDLISARLTPGDIMRSLERSHRVVRAQTGAWSGVGGRGRAGSNGFGGGARRSGGGFGGGGRRTGGGF
ncbi:MAG: hypothetical protein H4O13_14655 [Xanthomonadales bacterium]|nr:hypothetical protein [Xanthomonadales bacterium]